MLEGKGSGRRRIVDGGGDCGVAVQEVSGAAELGRHGVLLGDPARHRGLVVVVFQLVDYFVVHYVEAHSRQRHSSKDVQ